MIDYTSHTGSQYQKHARPVMSCSLMAARKGVVAAASVKTLHSNALLSLCVKENVLQALTNDVSQFHKDSMCIHVPVCTCISTEIYVFTLLVC